MGVVSSKLTILRSNEFSTLRISSWHRFFWEADAFQDVAVTLG
jgi:hypothetical protein